MLNRTPGGDAGLRLHPPQRPGPRALALRACSLTTCRRGHPFSWILGRGREGRAGGPQPRAHACPCPAQPAQSSQRSFKGDDCDPHFTDKEMRLRELHPLVQGHMEELDFKPKSV